MLKELSIRNFAIIDDLQLRLDAGLSVLSGETGAGKTIIVNALNLILGSRAASEMIRTGAEAAEVEALFEVPPDSPVRRAAAGMGYTPDQGLLVRRVISRADGNRVYINGRLATLQVLGAVTENLASISGQHAHQGLLREEQHLLILDQVSGLLPQREAVAGLYREILPLIKSLKSLVERRRRQAEATELLRFQQQEIAAAALEPEEDRKLEEERLRLRHAETIRQSLQAGIEALYGEPGAVCEKLTLLKRDLERIGRFDPRLAKPQQLCADIAFRVEDLVAELQSQARAIEVDDRRLEAVEERLDALNRLKRKYGGTLAAVLEKLAETGRELGAFENLGAEIADVEKRVEALRQDLQHRALALSKSRREAARRFGAQVASELAALKMAGTRFEVAFAALPADAETAPQLRFEAGAVSESGIDRTAFMLAPNVGEALKPLAAIASGGELSRVVLALKSILAGSEALGTIVFDEVDAGIGGAVAETVGRKLCELARHHQVICITHLPQIAKFGDRHYRITKLVAKGRTRTRIEALAADERVKEIARMLGGEKITPITLAHARELLENKKPPAG